ncbi:MAG: hypothetical protein ACI8RZ_001751 [Myxococcota bacterium]|jgi:hypothetical protein
MRISLLTVGLASIVLGLGAMFSSHALAGGYEEPTYEVVQSSADWELRQYAPVIEAQVTVEGPYDQAVRDGFRLLAGYIFGKNEPNETIAMTVPVAAQSAEGQKIAMTVPVATAASAPAAVDEARSWTVAFTMPGEWDLDTLPAPMDARVRLVEVPEQRWAVLRFSGKASAQSSEQYRQELLEAVITEGLEPSGAAVIAQYNPPWVPGFLRRNEVKIPVGSGDAATME